MIERVRKMKNILLCLEFSKTMRSVYFHFPVHPVHKLLSHTLTIDCLGNAE